MKKFLLTLLAISVGFGSAFAAASSTPELYTAIKKYKSKNYVGCIQDMQDLVKKDPSNAVAYYYLAISYANIGKKEEAINAYQKVTSLSTNEQLVKYAAKGEKCLVSPEECKAEEQRALELDTEIDKFIKSGSSFSKDASRQMQQIRMEQLKNSINSEVDQKSEAPTNDEIAEAVKTLARAGVNPLQMTGMQNPYMQAMYQNPEYMQMQMMMGSNNRSNGFDYLGMLPYLMSQNKNNSNPNVSADMIKNMMMSSMIGDMTTTFDLDSRK